jgi:shikimate dehydrogenase
MRITGHTRILFILADPVEHVRGSDMLNRWFEAQGDDVAASPLHVVPADLGRVIDAIRAVRNVAGFGVTIPHKIAVGALLDRLTPRARQVGAVNFVRRDSDGTLTGDNVDGVGFVDGLARAGVGVAGRSVLLLGAGGAGRAIAFGLAEACAARIVVANRTASRAAELAAAVGAAFPACEVVAGEASLSGVDVLVNATSVGMHGPDALPLDVSALTSATDVAEIIMAPEVTPLLREAERRGCRTVPGRFMLEEQIKRVKAFVLREAP